MKSRKIKLNTNATTSGGKLYTKKATIYTNRMNHTETAGWLASQIQDFLLNSYTLAVFQQGLHPSQRSKKSAQTLLQRCMHVFTPFSITFSKFIALQPAIYDL